MIPHLVKNAAVTLATSTRRKSILTGSGRLSLLRAYPNLLAQFLLPRCPIGQSSQSPRTILHGRCRILQDADRQSYRDLTFLSEVSHDEHAIPWRRGNVVPIMGVIGPSVRLLGPVLGFDHARFPVADLDGAFGQRAKLRAGGMNHGHPHADRA